VPGTLGPANFALKKLKPALAPRTSAKSLRDMKLNDCQGANLRYAFLANCCTFSIFSASTDKDCSRNTAQCRSKASTR